MTPTVYIETSIISYLAAQPSRDLITAAHQQITHDWWRRRRSAFLAEAVALPVRAGADALHIAIATIHGIDYLLTWNCTHIANAELRILVERACRKQGYMAPTMCTPEELMEEMSHDD